MTEASKSSNVQSTRNLAEKMLVSSKRLNRLMENLMEWAKMQTGRLEPQPVIHDLNPLIKEIVELLSETAAQKKICLLNEIPHNTLVYADSNMVHTIIRNLVANAIKFTHPQGEVRITAKEGNSLIEVNIADNGVGIPEEKINDLFQIDRNFSTIGTANETGTGLGLILCKEMIGKNQGKIWVESQLNQSTIFIFTLPKSAEAVSEES